jgi:hypothetical protein
MLSRRKKKWGRGRRHALRIFRPIALRPRLYGAAALPRHPGPDRPRRRSRVRHGLAGRTPFQSGFFDPRRPLDAARRSLTAHLPDPAWHGGDASAAPQPGQDRGRGGDRRSPEQRAARIRRRPRHRAASLRGICGADGGEPRAVRRSARFHHRRLDRRALLVRGPILSSARTEADPAADPVALPADTDCSPTAPTRFHSRAGAACRSLRHR